MLDRRRFLSSTAVTALTPLVISSLTSAAVSRPSGRANGTARVAWLDGNPPSADEGQCWGQPWPRGTRYSGKGYKLVAGASETPLQSWPLAWWPDGSIKWTGHAAPASALATDAAEVVPGTCPLQASLKVTDGDQVVVACAGVQWTLPRRGSAIIATASIDGTPVLRDLHLLAMAQDGPDDAPQNPSLRSFDAAIDQVTVEQDGPLRAVVRVEGHHVDASARVLPFTLRLYFHAGSQCVRVVHSMVFDHQPDRTFLRGLGLRGTVPMRGALHDRHVRFGGEDGGLWGEAVRPLTGLRRDPGAAFRAAQIAGNAAPPLDQMPQSLREKLAFVPAWGDFTLSQPNSDGYTIEKRTAAGHGWIKADGGRRSPGFAFAGTPSGGAAFGLSDFWQRAPVRLDVRNAHAEAAEVTVWHHAPDAPAMDMRFYHDDLGMNDYYTQNKGLDITYEDFEPGWGDSQGIARTTEFRIWALAGTPDRATLRSMADVTSRAPRLLADREGIHAAGIFGIWELSASARPIAAIDQRFNAELEFYLGQVDQRRWYGFWDYGDVMHSYDNDRHVWRYDIGGFAWDNSELSTDLWLWYGYLRTGRADVFRMAEAMCRHTGEVDVYHSGRFKGLGTRHGVQHWGDSSKQPRISNAAYRRIYYYLTADERSGDLMRALLGSEECLRDVVIERKVGDVAAPATSRPSAPAGQVAMSFGTVWGSLISAWLAEWERTGERKWRDRIVAGMESIAALPKQWFAGSANYDFATGRFTGPGNKVEISHLNGAFGVFEMHAELLELVSVPAYREAWLDYCEFYNAPAAIFERKTGAAWQPRGLRQGHSRFTAYAAFHRRRPDLAKRAWDEFSGQGDRPDRKASESAGRIEGPAVLRPVDEIAGISTNDAAQWGLAALQLSALIPEFAPALDR